MKLSISNIGWETEYNEQVYALMKTYGFSGIEIAPTVWVPESPYETRGVEKARQTAKKLKQKYEFTVSSMQSILYGKTEQLFGTESDRKELYDYLVKAIDYAAAIGCGNLVFGCPRNRCFPEDWCNNANITHDIELDFFQKLGDYAKPRGTVLSMEANPLIYNTNYINTTPQAIKLVEEMNSEGFLLNLDVGTMVCNEESASLLGGKVQFINHVHISEPGLKVIEERKLHKELAEVLEDEGYNRFISIEVGKNNLGKSPLESLEIMMEYVAKVFG